MTEKELIAMPLHTKEKIKVQDGIYVDYLKIYRVYCGWIYEFDNGEKIFVSEFANATDNPIYKKLEIK